MILDATLLTHHQSCARRPVLETDWYPRRWRPKTLFDLVLTRAILSLSSGTSAESCAETARVEFLERAANPGLDLEDGVDPYQQAKDWCVMYETILRVLAKITLLMVKTVGTVSLNSSTGWRGSSLVDDTGTLHRWVTVDRWDADALSREMHSWYTFGDMTAFKSPMMIHAIEIGQIRKGRRASAWARGWRHPSLSNVNGVHFKHRDGSSFTGWTAMHLADHVEYSADDWVDAMIRDRAGYALIHQANLNALSESALAAATGQMLVLGHEIQRAITERGSAPWNSLPMSRGACDSLIPCVWQSACYSENIVDLAATGLYTPREKATAIAVGKRG